MPSSRRRIRRITRRSGEGSSVRARSSASGGRAHLQQGAIVWRVPTRLPDRAASRPENPSSRATSSARASQSAAIGSVSSSDPGGDHHRDGLHAIEVASLLVEAQRQQLEQRRPGRSWRRAARRTRASSLPRDRARPHRHAGRRARPRRSAHRRRRPRGLPRPPCARDVLRRGQERRAQTPSRVAAAKQRSPGRARRADPRIASAASDCQHRLGALGGSQAREFHAAPRLRACAARRVSRAAP